MSSALSEMPYYILLAAGAFALLVISHFLVLVQRWRALQARLTGLQANATKLKAGR